MKICLELSTITYQRELLADFFRDAQVLFPQHYDELALNKGQIKLSLDVSRYEMLEKENALHIATVRDDGNMVGYFVSFLIPHMHYKDAGTMGMCDMYWLAPSHRIGGVGARFLCFVEKCMKELKVSKLYWSHKVHQDHSDLFKALGFTPSDIMYTKMVS